MTVFFDGVHLAATDLEELHAFATRLGLKRSWFQCPPEHRHPHYDVMAKRLKARAISMGAVPTTAREIVRITRGAR